MNVQGLNPIQMIASVDTSGASKSVAQTNTTDFQGFLKKALEDVNAQQIKSNEDTTRLAMGENIDLHNVMISAQKASISLQATIEVRNKIVEAYQEIMRMQV